VAPVRTVHLTCLTTALQASLADPMLIRLGLVLAMTTMVQRLVMQQLLLRGNFKGGSASWAVGCRNNLPDYILVRPERQSDVILSFDASSDVRTGSAIRRLRNFADDCHIELEGHSSYHNPPRAHLWRVPMAEQNSPSRTVFRGTRESGKVLYLVYCPSLPNGINPGFDSMVGLCHVAWYASLRGFTANGGEMTASFSNSHN